MKSSKPLLLLLGCFCFVLLLANGTEAVGQTDNATAPAEVARILADLEAQPSDPKKQNVARTTGFRLISLGRYEDAWNVFRVVLQTAPRDQQSLYGGALALLNSNRVKEARELAESAMTIADAETATATD